MATKTTVTLEDGQTLEADLYIPAFGMRYNTGFMAVELLTAQGRVATNPATLRVDAAGPRVYACYDKFYVSYVWVLCFCIFSVKRLYPILSSIS